MSFDQSQETATGMLLGKFMPPHLGHIYLADFARNFVSDLTIVVGTLPSEPISGHKRFEWMKTLFPQERVVHLHKDLPQDPSEHPEFWTIWRNALQEVLPFNPKYLFASENYGHKLAEVLGARFIPVDKGRSIRQVSGTVIRENPFEHWDLLPNCVRAHYSKRVVVFGPESTGKSTLSINLAKNFNTLSIPEYARNYLEEQEGELAPDDIPLIARGQIASEESLIPYSNKLAILDTDVLSTYIWSQFLYGECPMWIQKAAMERKADLYLLCDVDVPWVEDIVRYLPENRTDFFNLCEDELQKRKLNYVRLSGSWDDRLDTAIEAVIKLLS